MARVLKIPHRQAVNVICRNLADVGGVRRTTLPNGKIESIKRCTVKRGYHGRRRIPTLTARSFPPNPFVRLTKHRVDCERIVPVGGMRLGSEGNLEADTRLPVAAGAYAFVEEEIGVYVGAATMGLRPS